MPNTLPDTPIKTAREYADRIKDALRSNLAGVKSAYRTFDNFYRDFAIGLKDFPKANQSEANRFEKELHEIWNSFLPSPGITCEQALKRANYGTILHYTGKHPCTRTTGPRGGITESITRVRVSGRVKTWKRTPEKFEFPVKYGLYENATVDNHFHRNSADFHFEDDCPLLKEEELPCPF